MPDPPKQMSEETRARLVRLEDNYAEALLIRERGFAISTVIGTLSVCVTAMGFVAFFLAAAWYERKPSVDTMLWTSVMGVWVMMMTAFYGVGQSKRIKAKMDEMTKAITSKDN